jgi:asparagine synthase (glutamine-hydrolysing)
MRMVSDVPLGILLSGGIDSSVVAALAVRASSETVKTFSISFAESSFDESQYARAVAKFLGTDHHEERFSASLAANLVGEIGAWMDEPISDPSVVPTYLLSALPESMSRSRSAATAAMKSLPAIQCTSGSTCHALT